MATGAVSSKYSNIAVIRYINFQELLDMVNKINKPYFESSEIVDMMAIHLLKNGMVTDLYL